MALVDEGASAQKLLEHELHELDKQRIEVEQRLRELANKERQELGRYGGRGGPLKRSREVDPQSRGVRPEFRPYRPPQHQDAFQPNKRRFIDDDKAPKVTSTVVKVNEKDPEKPHPSLAATEDDKKRHRKMFGFLLGTLQQFKKEGEVKSEVEAKRQEIEQKVESKVEQEKAELLAQHKQIIDEQKERELKLKGEIKKKQEETELAILEGKWAKHHALLDLFQKTKATPVIYYAFNPNAPPLELLTTTTTTKQENETEKDEMEVDKDTNKEKEIENDRGEEEEEERKDKSDRDRDRSSSSDSESDHSRSGSDKESSRSHSSKKDSSPEKKESIESKDSDKED